MWNGAAMHRLRRPQLCVRKGGVRKKLTSGESSVEKLHDLPLSAIEVSVGILLFDLLDSPPGRRGEHDVVTRTFGHARVENTDHFTQAVDDECARVAFGGEIARLLVVVVNGKLDRLLPKIIGDVSLEAGILAHGDIGLASIF